MARQRQHQPIKTTRHLTIQETANLYQLKYAAMHSSPAIRLRGHWLASAGFLAGRRVSIVVESGRLIMTIASDPTTPQEESS